jgi:hypothetical protein
MTHTLHHKGQGVNFLMMWDTYVLGNKLSQNDNILSIKPMVYEKL